MRTPSHSISLFVGSAGLLASLIVVGPTAAAELPTAYTITDLGTLGGGSAIPHGINNAGQVVGESTTPAGAVHAFLHDGTRMIDLGTLGGSSSSAAAINDTGQIVGGSLMPGNLALGAFLYNGTLVNLGALDGPQGYATGINADGQIAGAWGIPGTPFQRGFLRGSDGRVTPLGALGGSNSIARGINDTGQVVGLSSTLSGEWHAFRTAPGVAINPLTDDLGTLGGAGSWANAVNASGQVAGASWVAGNGGYHAFLYTAGRMLDLGTLGGRWSEAFALNAAGQVVGEASTPTGEVHAFLYSDGQMQDLNARLPAGAGALVTAAHAINDSGKTAVVAVINGQSHPAVLTPVVVPPPGTFGLPLAGSLGAKPVTYTFDANARDAILLRLARGSGEFKPHLVLRDPSGFPIADKSGDTCVEVTALLIDSGTYTVEVSDATGTGKTGQFGLYIQRLNLPGRATHLAVPDSTSDGISFPAEMKTYTVSGNAGDKIKVTVIRTAGSFLPLVRVYDPNGSFLAGDWEVTVNVVAVTLPVTGSYTILVGDRDCDETGSYGLSVSKQ